mmetsp:Transcript_17172/g.37124  ORF Transcript_17172/g.37124 Transcript_17172/m.37124 type:complete len:88 (+) Transcript_17172:118-381(+)
MFTAQAILTAYEAGVAWMLENPADSGDRNNSATFWFPDHAPLWMVPFIRLALDESGAQTVTFSQCESGAKARKHMTLAYAAARKPYV